MKKLILALLIVGHGVMAAETPVGFESAPTAKRHGNTVTVRFALSGPSDVAVYVLDAQGKCVRHLGAGMLGSTNPPPAPLKPGLSQSLEWDGKDDYGKPAAGGSFRVRVALGLKPKFAGFLNWHPDALPKTVLVAVGPQGNLYYFYQDPVSNFNMGGHKVKVRGRDGKHLRTLVPFRADIKPERHKVYGALTDKDGHVAPRIHNWESMSLAPTMAGGRRRDTACYTPVVDSQGRLYWTVRGEHLICVDAEGRCPYPTYLGKPIFPGARYSNWSGAPARYLAMSGDDKYVYISAVSGNFNGKKETRHCVYRVDVATRGEAEPFVGDPSKAGGGKTLLSSPRGVATAKGLIYVADMGNNRVVAFKESDKTCVGEIKTPRPYHVSVDRKTGALYVISEPKKLFPELLKFVSLKATKPTHVMKFPKSWGAKGPWTMALDDSASPVRLYFPSRAYSGKAWAKALPCLEDTPSGFKVVEVPTPKGRYAFWHKDLTIDQRRGELYVKASHSRWDRFDAETGAYQDSVSLKGTGGPNGGQVVADSKGRLVTYTWVHKSSRPALSLWTRDGKKIPTTGKGWSGVMTFQQKFMDITPKDELYVRPGTGGKQDWPAGSPGGVTVFDMNLQPKRTAIWQCSDGCVVKTDLKGNIYLGENVRPLKRMIPEFFDGKLKAVKDQGIGGGDWYSYMYGSIVKSSPKGGAVWFKEPGPGGAGADKPGMKEVLAMPKRPFNFRMRHKGPKPPGQLQGAEWVRFGFAPYASTYGGGTPRCQCEGSGFDVDGFGRVFYPNLGRFRVEVIDNNNNFIGTFGQYGNADSQLVPTDSKDGKPLISVPAIPLSWPTYVAAGDNYAYVADVVGMRTVKVKLGYTLEKICTIEK